MFSLTCLPTTDGVDLTCLQCGEQEQVRHDSPLMVGLRGFVGAHRHTAVEVPAQRTDEPATR